MFLAGRDFTNLSVLLTFTSGETVGNSRCFAVNILDDSVVESTETFSITVLSDGLIQTINITSTNVTVYEDMGDGMLLMVQNIRSGINLTPLSFQLLLLVY